YLDASFIEPSRRADLVKASRDFKASQIVGRDQILIHDGEIESDTFGAVNEGRRAKNAQTIVDVVHVRRVDPFVVGDDAAAGTNHVTAVPLVVVAADGHQATLTAGHECLLDCSVIAVQKRITVQNEETFAELRQRFAECAAGAQTSLPVVNVPQTNAPTGAIAKRGLDHLAEIAQ